MKFTADQLFRALTIAQKFVHKNPVLAVDEYVYLKKHGVDLELMATDLDNTCILQYKVGGKKDFDVLIDPAILKALKTKSDVDINIIRNKDQKLDFVEYDFDDESKLKMENIAVGDFPNMQVALDFIFVHDKNVFEILKKAATFTTSDEMRPAMTGVGVVGSKEKKTVTFVGSDGHKLYRHTLPTENIFSDFSFVLTKMFINKLTSFYPKETGWYSSKAHTQVEFMHDNMRVRLINRTIQQSYPDFNAVVPVNQQRSFKVSKKEFVKKLTEVDAWTNKTTRSIVIDLKEKNISTKDLDLNTDYSVKFNAETQHEDRMIFNCRFLLELLKIIDKDELIFEYNVSDQASLFGKVTKPVTINNGNELFLIMPIIDY